MSARLGREAPEIARTGVRLDQLGLLRERRFRLLLVARAASAGADAMLPAVVTFAVIHARSSITEVGLIVAAFTSSRLALTPVSGVWADRLPRRLLVLGGHLLQAGAMAAVALLLLSDHAQTWVLTAASCLYGAGSAFVLPALTGLVAETVRATRLQAANAMIGLSVNIGYAAGPAIAGLLAAVAGPAGGYGAEALACMTAAFCLARIRLPALRRPKTNTFLRDMAAGWRELLTRPWYLLNICAHGFWNFGTACFWVLGPLIASAQLGGPAAWGVISTGGILGAFAGGLLALRWAPRRPLVTANLALALSAFELLALVGPSPLFIITVAALVSAAGLTFLNVTWDTTMQQIIPQQALSRVSSCDWLISLAPVPAAYALTGPLSLALGFGPLLAGAAVVVAGPCALVVLLPGVRGVNRQASGRIVDGSLPPSSLQSA